MAFIDGYVNGSGDTFVEQILLKSEVKYFFFFMCKYCEIAKIANEKIVQICVTFCHLAEFVSLLLFNIS